MSNSNYERMIQLADEVFAVKSDPAQLDVNEEVLERLKQMHPATIAEFADRNGPVAWVLVIPTTTELMNQFLKKKISEKELFDLTPLNIRYEAVYLCSALVLEEYRRKGLAKKLSVEAVEKIRRDHPIKALFAWPFTPEGDLTLESITHELSLPMFRRKD